jgi:hypothetical protein
MPTLSVVIPLFNHASFIGQSVASCVHQSHPPDEVIVVDDASTDGSEVVLSALVRDHPRLRLIHHKENLGAAAALNTGVQAARSDWVLARAADDLSPPGSFAAFQRAAEAFPNAGLITGDLVYFESDAERGTREPTGRSRQHAAVSPKTFVETFGGNILHGAASFVRTEWARDEGGFDEALRWHCDWFLLMSLGLSRGFVYAPDVLGAMRLNPYSYNARGTAAADQQSQVMAHLIARLEQKPDMLEYCLAVGCLDFFGEPLQALLRLASPARRRRFAPILRPPTDAVRAARNATGPALVLREFLTSQAARIRSHAGAAAIFGAGGHTRQLLAIWRELDLPRPAVILDTAAFPPTQDIDGVPVGRPAVVKKLSRPLVILSSKSYEPLFASAMEAELPGVPYLKIWGANGA